MFIHEIITEDGSVFNGEELILNDFETLDGITNSPELTACPEDFIEL